MSVSRYADMTVNHSVLQLPSLPMQYAAVSCKSVLNTKPLGRDAQQQQQATQQ